MLNFQPLASDEIITNPPAELFARAGWIVFQWFFV